MAKGEYEFAPQPSRNDGCFGEMKVLLPGETSWKTFGEFETFTVLKIPGLG
jgi:uncharacterized protein YaiE (UPF0345 family)